VIHKSMSLKYEHLTQSIRMAKRWLSGLSQPPTPTPGVGYEALNPPAPYTLKPKPNPKPPKFTLKRGLNPKPATRSGTRAGYAEDLTPPGL